MRQRSIWTAGLLVVALVFSTPAAPQTSPDSLAAAKELMTTMRMTDQVTQLLPILMQNIKPMVVQGRPEVERDYDRVAPILTAAMSARIGELLNAIAELYAQNFTASELGEVTTFYRGATGQKFLQKLPALMQQSMTLGQRFGESLAPELQNRMIEELRKKGHKI